MALLRLSPNRVVSSRRDALLTFLPSTIRHAAADDHQCPLGLSDYYRDRIGLLKGRECSRVSDGLVNHGSLFSCPGMKWDVSLLQRGGLGWGEWLYVVGGYAIPERTKADASVESDTCIPR